MKNLIVQLAIFTAKARKLGLTEEDIRQLELAIMEDAKTAPVMAGTGGLRKV